MFIYTVFIFSAFVTVQCQMHTLPYPRPCQCGLPPIPVNPPCASQVQIFAAPYEIPAALPNMALPSALPKMALAASPYELSLPIAYPKMAIPAGYELPLPVQSVMPNMAVMPAPYELALPLPLPNPSCGCLEAAISRPVAELPLPVGFPLNNPFLPAASPVSALAPFNPMLPPATPCSRCQYLKKIPIPPPCI